MERKYEFHWDLIGDPGAGHPNPGLSTRAELYRLMAFTLRDIFERRYHGDH